MMYITFLQKWKSGDGVIESFKDERTKWIFDGEPVKRLDGKVYKAARKRLIQLEAAIKIEDLYFPPSNKFHRLEGHSPTRYAIRVNEQWRITFEWKDGKAYNVLFEDYH
jgi:proteic killer suppression protein